MDFLKENEENLCIWLSSDPESIIDACGDLLTRNNCKALEKECDYKEKMLCLLKIIIALGESVCQTFKEILKLQKQFPDIQQLFNKSTQVSTGQKMFADNSSVIDNRSLTNTTMKSLKMSVDLPVPSNSARYSNQPGQGVSQPPQGADCIATNNSSIFNNTIQDCSIDGDVDFSMYRQMSTVDSTEPAKQVENEYSSEGPSLRMIREHKPKLIDWLQADPSFILQHLQSKQVVTDRDYQQLRSITQPEDVIKENYPELGEWINTYTSPGPPESKVKRDCSIPDKCDFLKRNRSNLVSKVKNIKPIVDDLQSKGGFHAELADSVHAQLTPQDMMRGLLDGTNSTRAAEALVEALFKHQSDVMEDLIDMQQTIEFK